MASFIIPSNSKSTVILDRPADWDEWLFLIEFTAQHSEISSYINLSKLEPSELVEPAEPISMDIKESVTALTGLFAEKRDIYKILRDEYKIKLMFY
jgi:hypothetical protein